MSRTHGKTPKRERAVRLRSGLARTAWPRLPLASAISAILIGTPAMAQEQETATLGDVTVTAQKRRENLQDVPLSVTAIGTEQIEELNITDFGDYVKFLPSVAFTSFGPGFSVAYFRGVASGENSNHSGPQPTVAMYLDEQPITTIQGALDIHLYDIERVESLPGPQGTLYGSSSMAGTIRIITNKPDPSGFDAGYGLEANTVSGGSQGYIGEGFVNIPMGSNAAVRLVGWYRKDAGFIDNVPARRDFPTSGGCIVNFEPAPVGCVTTPERAEDDYNDVETYGARAALRIDLNDSWSMTPTVMAQKQKSNGIFSFNPVVGDLETARFYPDESEDKWMQAALTVEGRISKLDLVYAGAYLKRDDFVNSDYSDYSYFYDTCCGYGSYWYDDDGVPLSDPSQFINGKDYYKRQSHEIRVSSPQDWPVRFVTGLFYSKQEHEIYQNYQIGGLSADISVSDWEDTIWLTNQLREDKDWAFFGEVTFDMGDHFSFLAGWRRYEAENSLRGFFGFGAGYSSNYGEFLCFSPERFKDSPCTNLDDNVDESGWVPKATLTYKVDDDRLLYATYSEGFRPGGINRNGTVPPYDGDTLTNYELGWKTTWAGNRLRFNGALFHEQWDDIQFSFLPPSGAGLTVIRNAGKAEIKGVEMDLTWLATENLLFSGGLAYIDSELKEDYIPDPDEPPDAFAGSSLPVTPDFKGNIIARYGFDVGSARAYFQGAAVYTGSSYSDLIQSVRDTFGKQDSFTIADFTAGFDLDTMNVELFINNAFDERARQWTYAACTEGVCGINPYYVMNQPRTFGVKFGQRF